MASVIPTFIKTWSLVQNQAYVTTGVVATDNKNMVLLIVNQLITWGWTVSGSGSSNYGSGARDGTNRWRTVADIVASAWIELHNGTMGCYLQLFHNSSNSGQFTWQGSYAGFSGGTINATTAGTASDSFNCNTGNGTNFPIGNAAFSAKWHGWASSDGYVNRIIVYNNSVPVFCLHMEKPTVAVTGFPNCVMGISDEGGGSSNNQLLLSTWFTSYMWFVYYASARRGVCGVLPYIGGVATPTSAQAQTIVNPVDTNWTIVNVGAGANVATTSLFAGIFFWFADLWSIATALQEGATLPASGARQVVVCGDLLLPWSDVAMQVV
jgi:hypothetical protein